MMTENYEHSFNVGLAVQCGVDEAIMLKNIYFWVLKNQANNKSFHENKFWTYNSAKAFEALFPYWTEHQIRRILKSLLDQELIEKGSFNKVAYDRTNWYTLTLKAYGYFTNSILLNNEMEVAKQRNGSSETTKPIPNINKDGKPNINKDKSKGKPKRFIKPTLEQIEEYIKRENYNVNPNKFFNHYESNGWKVGRNSMKSWEASIRTWHYSDLNTKNKDEQKEVKPLDKSHGVWG